MVVSTKSKAGYIYCKDLRRCRFYALYLNSELKLPIPIQAQTSAEICSKINSVLDDCNWGGASRSRFVEVMEQVCSAQILLDQHFDWFKKNDRACYWMWGSVRLAQNQTLGLQEVTHPPIYLYQQIVSNQNPSSTKERYECVVEFFDRWNQHLDFKMSFLQQLKANWGVLNANPPPFKWLSEDDDQCRWASEYLMKSNIPTGLFNPVDIRELYRAVIAAFDLWSAPPDSKKLFLQNINKAWSQKKHRDTLVGKKSLNTYLKEDTKQKLNELSELKGRKIHEVLEELIVREYEKLK